MDSITDEIFSDFKDSVAKIDFNSYNPNSLEFLTALNIGLMWHLMNEVNGGTDTVTIVDRAEKDDISDEIFGAKKYFQKYIDLNDPAYKEMAKEELKHAEILIKKANAKLPSGEEKSKLKEYENELNSLRIEMA